MKVRLVRPRCFVLTMLPLKSLASWTGYSVLFPYAYEFLCSWMLAEGIEIFQRSRLQENSGSMETVDPWELKFVRYTLRLEDLTKSFKWRAYVMSGGVSTRLHAQYLPQGKEKLLLREILSLKRSCLPPPALYSDWIARSKYTVESPSKWTTTTHFVETSESIEPNDTNLEVNAVGYTFSKIF